MKVASRPVDPLLGDLDEGGGDLEEWPGTTPANGIAGLAEHYQTVHFV